MRKALSLIAIVAAISGCQTQPDPSDTDPGIVGLRCMLLAGKQPFKRENLRYIESKAEDGVPLCTAALGKMYQEGGYGVDQDFSKARKLFVESARVSSSSNVLLGQMAERGEGEPVDYAKARDFYRLAGRSGEQALAGLLEEGKGGPQDRAAALALYMGQVRFYGDDAWQAMDRLRKQGQALDEAQTQRFMQLWVQAFQRLQSHRLAVREVLEAVNTAGVEKRVTLVYRFKTDGSTPEITMTQSSGDATLDAWVMTAASRIKMSDPGPLADEAGVFTIKAPLILTPQDASKAPWLCGAKPCNA